MFVKGIHKEVANVAIHRSLNHRSDGAVFWFRRVFQPLAVENPGAATPGGEFAIQLTQAGSISTFRRPSPRVISSPDCNRTPRAPGGTGMVLPSLRTLVPCKLRSSQRR